MLCICMLVHSDCGRVCHSKCSDQLLNNCGLPPELVDFDLSQPSSAKKPKRKEGEGEEGECGGTEGVAETPRSVSLVRRPDDTIKLGRVHVPK